MVGRCVWKFSNNPGSAKIISVARPVEVVLYSQTFASKINQYVANILVNLTELTLV